MERQPSNNLVFDLSIGTLSSNLRQVVSDETSLPTEQIPEAAECLSDSVFIYKNKKLSEHGNVFEGEIRSDVCGTRPWALKFARKSDENTMEAKILSKLGSHTHIISIIQSGVYEDLFESYAYIALDKCHEQNLHQYFEQRKALNLLYDVNVGLEYSKQIIAGLKYVHENLIFHKDLKPSNILLSHDRKTIKLADFGLSQELKTISSKVFCKHQFGTNGFRPAESFGNSWASLKSDIFSLGVVFYFLLSNGRSPFGENFHLWTYNIRNGVTDVSSLLVENPGATEHLIKLMLSNERCHRPSIWQVSTHPCWTGSEMECSFDYGCDKEVDDSVISDPKDLKEVVENAESKMKGARELLRAMKNMGIGRRIILETSIIIFDKKSKCLQRFNPNDRNVTTIHEFNDEMKKTYCFSSASYRNFVYVMMERHMYRLIYGDVKAKWERMADLIGKHGPWPHSVVVSDEIIAVAGSDSIYSNSVTKYIPALNKWENINNKKFGTSESALVTSQSFVYCIGGWTGQNEIDTVERLNLASGSWDEVAPLREARWLASAVTIAGKIIVAGGRKRLFEKLSLVEQYDPDMNQWTIIKPMIVERGDLGFRCQLIEKNIYAVGPGYRGIEKYHIENDTWEAVKLPEGMKLHIWGSVTVKTTK